MPYVEGTDERAHTTTEEKTDHAQQIVDFARSLITEGQGNAPACNQCLHTTLVLAQAKLLTGMFQSEHVGELMGIAAAADRFALVLRETSQALVNRGVEVSIGRRGGLESFLDMIFKGAKGADH